MLLHVAIPCSSFLCSSIVCEFLSALSLYSVVPCSGFVFVFRSASLCSGIVLVLLCVSLLRTAALSLYFFRAVFLYSAVPYSGSVFALQYATLSVYCAFILCGCHDVPLLCLTSRRSKPYLSRPPVLVICVALHAHMSRCSRFANRPHVCACPPCKKLCATCTLCA